MRCKNCKEKFVPKVFLQKYCLKNDCIVAMRVDLMKKQIEQCNKRWAAEKKVMVEKLKTHKDYLNELQIVFNTFIRLRDKDKGCISCGANMVGRKGDASHYYSVGSAPELRFNEDNVHLACVPCNKFKHGNLLEYSNRLPKRIGWVRFSALQDAKGISKKLSIPELKAKTAHYKSLIKIMNEK